MPINAQTPATDCFAGEGRAEISKNYDVPTLNITKITQFQRVITRNRIRIHDTPPTLFATTFSSVTNSNIFVLCSEPPAIVFRMSIRFPSPCEKFSRKRYDIYMKKKKTENHLSLFDPLLMRQRNSRGNRLNNKQDFIRARGIVTVNVQNGKN